MKMKEYVTVVGALRIGFSALVLTLLLTSCGQPTTSPTPTAQPTPTAVPTPTMSPEQGSIDEAADQQIQTLAEQGKIPSLAAAIVVNDSLVWTGGYGEQPGLDTVYMVGSIDKSFTATATLQLHERGLVDLDDDISDYLPFEVRHPDYPDIAITIRMLLTHRAGLVHDFPGAMWFDNDDAALQWASDNLGLDLTQSPYRDGRPSHDEYVESFFAPGGSQRTSEIWLAKPGTTYSYSNPGFYHLLSYVIESVTKRPLTEHIRESILEPLDLEDTSFEAADFAEEQLATPYVRFEDGYRSMPRTGSSATGRLRTTAPDLARFMAAHMNQGELSGIRILQPESVALMHDRAVRLAFRDFNNLGLYGMGLGWMLWDDGLQGHSGNIPGFAAEMIFREQPEGGYGLVLMMNAGCSLRCDKAWYDAHWLAIRDLLLQEASRLYREQAVQ
jgi:CubicO group peptidase (beta-lactamase class C family)